MTRRLFLSFLLLLGASVPLSATEHHPGFTGSWAMRPTANMGFGFDLSQTKDQITGYHDAVARHGNRVDAVLPDAGKPSITGTVSGRMAHVHFRSGYDETANGDAILTLRPNGTLIWKITQSTGTHYLPETATLHREETKRTSSK